MFNVIQNDKQDAFTRYSAVNDSIVGAKSIFEINFFGRKI